MFDFEGEERSKATVVNDVFFFSDRVEISVGYMGGEKGRDGYGVRWVRMRGEGIGKAGWDREGLGLVTGTMWPMIWVVIDTLYIRGHQLDRIDLTFKQRTISSSSSSSYCGPCPSTVISFILITNKHALLPSILQRRL